MNKQVISITAALVIGLITGVLFTRMNDAVDPDNSMNADKHQTLETNLYDQPANQESESPEHEVVALKTRISELEHIIESYESETLEDQDSDNNENTENKSKFDPNSHILTTQQLVDAGIDVGVATDIINRNQAQELKKLELRDKAAREGYLGTSSYIKELRKLQNEEPSLRDEIGDDAYDKYLYTSGQDNRVQIISVMANSAAEQIGLKNGDVILSYGDQKLFEFRELQRATTKGARDEYINIHVMRDGALMDLWIQRGPLGIRLDMVRVKPQG